MLNKKTVYKHGKLFKYHIYEFVHSEYNQSA